ncbi:unnamed protein product [Macrosiphum euphorbiae]|uniref:Uncharacterized protein n=1 Tax=Macrosiphum euphorbiae TaxID=13131 RepID=A0AAV0Y5Z3_9HEMI|nr:unnamed protein product [Macrosiphum euphorbiae]
MANGQSVVTKRSMMLCLVLLLLLVIRLKKYYSLVFEIDIA